MTVVTDSTLFIECRRCLVLKESNDFYRHETNYFGFENTCKQCRLSEDKSLSLVCSSNPPK